MDEETKQTIKAVIPCLTMLGKITGMDGGDDFLNNYLMGSALWDLGEFGINFYKGFNDKEIKGYNFFEKRLLYDLPKTIWNIPKKVKKSINNFVETLSYFDADNP